MKIVRFKDGAYGIRRFTPFGYQYKDIAYCPDRLWWGITSSYFKDCKGTLKEVVKMFNSIKQRTKIDGGTPVFKKKINFSQ